jgi:hypothetical protein
MNELRVVCFYLTPAYVQERGVCNNEETLKHNPKLLAGKRNDQHGYVLHIHTLLDGTARTAAWPISFK